MKELPLKITIGEKYDPAMAITEQKQADTYFKKLVRHCMAHGKSRAEAERIERQNLGYFAGYYDNNVRQRVEKLFRCAHPIFGAIAEKGPPTAREAYTAGVLRGAKMRNL